MGSFMTVMATYNTMLRMTVGHFDYIKLQDANGVMAPMYFVGVAIAGYFVLRNMFIAILGTEFSKVGAEVREYGYHWVRSPTEIARDKRRRELQEQLKWRHPLDVKKATVNSSNRIT